MSFREVVPKSAPHQAPQSSFAAKMMDLAQENPVMKNLDGISGGVLGAVMATFAALANTVQAATTSLKESMPTSVDGNLSFIICGINNNAFLQRAQQCLTELYLQICLDRVHS
jgi:hypothetical protein